MKGIRIKSRGSTRSTVGVMVLIIILLSSFYTTIQLGTQVTRLDDQLTDISDSFTQLSEDYVEMSIDYGTTTQELESIREGIERLTGNPFTTELWPGTVQSENITGMQWYTYFLGSLENRTDTIAYPEQAATYIIFNSSNEVYAKNGATGQIDYGGSWDAGGVDGGNASAVILATTQAMSRGQTVMLKHGTYYIDTQILIQKQINIIGEGWGTTLSSSITNGDPVLNFTHATHLANTLIANFRITGNGAEGDGIYFSIPLRQNLFSNLRIESVGGNGISLKEGYDVGIEYVYISGCTGNAIYVDDTNQVTIFRSTLRTSDNGLEVTSMTSLQVIGCEFSGSDNAAIHLNDQTSTVYIIGNGFEAKHIAILVDGSSGNEVKTVLVDGNYFNAEVGAEVNLKVDYGKGVTFGSGNRIVDGHPQRFNITENSGGSYDPNIIYSASSLGANVNYTYTIHNNYYDGNWEIEGGSFAASGIDVDWVDLLGVNRTTWPSGSSYITADYVIMVDGGNYYAYNRTGAAVYSGANYATVANAAIDSLPGAEDEGIIVLGPGDFTFTATTGVGKQTRILGSGIETTTMSAGAAVDCFTIDSCASGASSWAITHMTIDMNDYAGDGIHGEWSSNSAQAHSEIGYLRIIDGAAGQHAIYLKRPMDIHGHDIRIGGSATSSWLGNGITFESVVGDSINWGNSVWENIRIGVSGTTAAGINFFGNEGSDLLNLMHFYYTCIIGNDGVGTIGVNATGLYWTNFHGINIEDVGTGFLFWNACKNIVVDGNYIGSVSVCGVNVSALRKIDSGTWCRSIDIRNCKITGPVEYIDYSPSGSVGASPSYGMNFLRYNTFDDGTPTITLGNNTYAEKNNGYNRQDDAFHATPFTTYQVSIDGLNRYLVSPNGDSAVPVDDATYMITGMDTIWTITGGTVANILVENRAGDDLITGDITLNYTYIPIGYRVTIDFTVAPTITISCAR